MGSTLQGGHGRLAVGAVVGALTCLLFALGTLTGDVDRTEPEPSDAGAVEPVPPTSGQPGAGVPVTYDPPASDAPTSSTTTTTTAGASASAESTTTTTTTTTTADEPVTTTTTRPPPPQPTTTTTRCTSLICID